MPYDPLTMQRAEKVPYGNIDENEDLECFEEDDAVSHLIRMDHEHHKRRRTNLVTVCAGVLLVLGLIIALSVGLSKNEENENSSPTKSINIVPPPPEDFEAICGVENVKTQKGYNECKAACEPAICCSDKGNGNCYDTTNKENCLNYMICSNTELASVTEEGENSDIPSTISENVLTKVAPSSLPSLCSPENTETSDGKIVCDDICRLAKCCWESDEKNCFAKNEVICEGYSACLSSDKDTDNNNEIDSPNDTTDVIVVDFHVEETCALEKLNSLDGQKECQELCSSRSCCFEEGSDNCSEDYISWCQEFSPCLNLETLVQNPGTGVNEDIDTEAPVSDVSNPIVQEQTGMNGFQMPVVAACAPGNLFTTEGIEICKSICKPRDCCFSENSNCYNDELKEWCDEYDVCKALKNVADGGSFGAGSAFSVHIGADTAGKEKGNADIFEVDLVCAPGNLQNTEGQDECKEICDTRACCFRHGDDFCGTRMPAECNRYVACKNLFRTYEDAEEALANANDTGGEPDDVDYEENESVNADMFLLKTVDEACTSGNLVSTKGRIECKQICDGRSCCFPKANAGTNDCYSQFPDWCGQYNACRALGADYQSGGSTFSEELAGDLNERCSGEKLRDFNVWMACNYLCEERACCKFDACPKKKEWCDGYETCQTQEINSFDHNSGGNSVEAVNSLSGESSITPEDANTACSRENVGLERGLQECKDVCKDKMCCFEKGTRNCSSDSKRQCFDFFACRVAVNANGGGSSVSSYVAIPPPNLADICAPQRIKNAIGYNECADKCMQVECCQMTDEGSCDQNMCTAFKACNSIWDSVFDGFEANAVSSEGKTVAELCSLQSVQTSRGRIQCQEACKPGSCCWAEGAGSCAKSQRQMCLKYTTCPKD